MSGIYLHIPYCSQKCSYCNFHFSINSSTKDEMLKAIQQELMMRNDEILQPIETIYFGGGTPSLLTPFEIQTILSNVKKNYKVLEHAEITLEANPENLKESYLTEIHQLGINRLSIGIQSFFDEDLKFMNRSHTSFQAEIAVKLAQKVGFDNISVDLIYGIPNQTQQSWEANVQKFLALNIQHISCYALTVEPKTILAHQIKSNQIKPINDEHQATQFEFLQDYLTKNGFSHYEISNFGKPDFYSKHNTSYWKGKPYVGLGPSAHSFDGKNLRKWNINHNQKYITSISSGILPYEEELLIENQLFNEKIMIGLRTEFGVDISQLEQQFSKTTIEHFWKVYHQTKDKNQLIIEKNKLKISIKNWFFADGIASDFFIV
jgi:oxygen-independent coproporphyrinogen-3 oxidase